MAVTSRQDNDMEKKAATLLHEVIALPDILFVMGKGPEAVMEGWLDSAKTRVNVQGEWVAVEGEAWHCHLKLSEISQIRFVEEDDVHNKNRRAFSIRFIREDGEPLLMIFFDKMYDSTGRLREDQVAIFRSLHQRYERSQAV